MQEETEEQERKEDTGKEGKQDLIALACLPV